MESWKLAINKLHGESYTYRFEKEPEEDYDKDLGVYEYTGEGLETRHNSTGKVLSVKRTGPLRVVVNVAGVVNWFVRRDDLDYEMEDA